MKKLSIILIVAGILTGLSPVAGHMYTEYQEKRMIAEWLGSEDASFLEEAEQGTAEDAYALLQEAFVNEGGRRMEEAAEAAAMAAVTQEAEEEAAAALKKESAIASVREREDNDGGLLAEIKGQTVLGIIRIDKIKLKAAVVEGVKPSDLKKGIGHIPGTALPGQSGNCALAGHRNYTFGRFFNRLDELVEGDEVAISTKKEELTYKVYKKQVVTPDEVSVLAGSNKDSIITLITCTPIYLGTHRLIVNAGLEEKVLKEP